MLDFHFIKDKLNSFRLRVVTRIKNLHVDLYVEKSPKESLSYSNLSELTPEQRYVLELEKDGKLRQIAKGVWEYTKR